MHRAWARMLFGIGSFVPILSVFGLAMYLVLALAHLDPDPTKVKAEDLGPLWVVLIGSTVVAFWQIAMGIIVALHTSGRRDLSSGAKAGWTLACLFMGSFALPIFTFVVLPGAAQAATPPMPPMPPGPMPPGPGHMQGRY